MAKVIGSTIWRRIDTPGHDACRLEKSSSGWQITGGAVSIQDGVPTCLAYRIACDSRWRTQQGHLRGWLGVRSVDFSITRSKGGVWTINGAKATGLQNCIDLDFGFTPATNLIQIRRLALVQGQVVDAPVAWLDVSLGTLRILDQRYERRSDERYWYEAPRFNYAAMIEVDQIGFIRRYPDLWEAELQQSCNE